MQPFFSKYGPADQNQSKIQLDKIYRIKETMLETSAELANIALNFYFYVVDFLTIGPFASIAIVISITFGIMWFVRLEIPFTLISGFIATILLVFKTAYYL